MILVIKYYKNALIFIGKYSYFVIVKIAEIILKNIESVVWLIELYSCELKNRIEIECYDKVMYSSYTAM